MVAGRICLYIGRARKRGRIRNREAAGTHTYLLRIRFAKSFSFFSFFSYACVGEAFVFVRARLMCLAAYNGKRRGHDLDCRQPRRSTNKTVILLTHHDNMSCEYLSQKIKSLTLTKKKQIKM